jgi:hypothetical protein
MPIYDEKPLSRLEDRRAPRAEQLEAEAERLRGERPRSFAERRAERERGRARPSVPPPALPPAA